MHATLAESLVGLNDPDPALPVSGPTLLPRDIGMGHITEVPTELTTTSIIDAPDDARVPLLHATATRRSLSTAIGEFDPLSNLSVEAAVFGATIPVQPTSGSFSVQFEFCMVQFERPWWNELLLSRQDWRVGGIARGSISTVPRPSQPAPSP